MEIGSKFDLYSTHCGAECKLQKKQTCTDFKIKNVETNDTTGGGFPLQNFSDGDELRYLRRNETTPTPAWCSWEATPQRIITIWRDK